MTVFYGIVDKREDGSPVGKPLPPTMDDAVALQVRFHRLNVKNTENRRKRMESGG